MKFCILTLALLLAMVCLSGTALAYDWLPEDVGTRTCELTMRGEPNMTFQVYRVCTVDRRVEFTPTSAFSSDETIQRLCSEKDWPKLLEYLKQYMVDKEIKPEKTMTVKDGETECVFKELPTGIYLVTGYKPLPSGRPNQTVPFLICLPNWLKADDPDNGTDRDNWIYKVSAAPKPIQETPDKIKVNKAWRNVSLRNRPDSVTVVLWQIDPETGRGKPYDEQTLDRRNGWSFTWGELPEGFDWVIRETDGSQGFIVDTDWTDMYNVTITNRLNPDKPKNDPDPDPPDPDPDPDPPPGPPNIPNEDLEDPPPPLTRPPLDDERTEDREPDPEDEEDLDDDKIPLAKLPQTGVLWWPVPFLAMGGMFLFILGWVLNRRGEYDEE